jgi:hypothetical protein
VGSGGDWTVDAYDALPWLDYEETAPLAVDYDIAPTPEPPLLEGMPDAATAPAQPATNVPPTVDIDSITVPDRP